MITSETSYNLYRPIKRDYNKTKELKPKNEKV
jgi:hypothetical protein